jgi:hypothetical protein
MGSAQPTLFGSFMNTFSYKNLSVSINIIYKAGYVFKRSSINYSQLFNNWNGNVDFVNRWQQPGDEKKTSVPSMPNLNDIDPSRDQFYNQSQAVVVKGDNIRLQDINLSYVITRKDWHAIPVDHIQIYVYGNNLGILWRANKYGLDPNYPTGIPLPPSIAFGVKAGF